MKYELILTMLLPMTLLGALIASMIFYGIVKGSTKLQRKMANGTEASRELLYGYLAVNTDAGIQKKKTHKSSAHRAKVYDIAYERKIRQGGRQAINN